MQRVQELSPIELVEMFVTVFCFLKDSSEVSQVLLDDFRAANGYIFLTEFLIKFVPFTASQLKWFMQQLVAAVLSSIGLINENGTGLGKR